MNEYHCRKCSESFDNQKDVSTPGNVICPNCGSNDLALQISAREDIEVTDHFAGIGERDGKKIGYRESERNGRLTAADQLDDGSFSYSISGSSPQGEEDTLHTCKLLVTVLNSMGGNWNDPTLSEGVADCISIDKINSNRKLSIQVIRGIADQGLWRELGQRGSFNESGLNREQLALEIKASILRKASDESIPLVSREGLILALDATRLPVLGLDDVVEEFQSRFGTWTRGLGFDAVWLVGPQPSLISRLDIQIHSNEAS
jgi:putative FmdB family regulatory protein